MQPDEIASRLAGLSPAKRALLERRRRGEAPATAAVSTIGRRAEAGPAPLSFPQQRMWLLDQLQPGAPTYNLRVLLRLTGPLDRAALGRGLQEVVNRHEVLRSAFREEAGAPAQVVLPRLDLPLPLIDLAGLPPAAREEESRRRTREIAGAGFDLSRPPLMRVALVALGASEHRLLVVQHHMVSDGWSMGVLVREVGALYEAFVAGRPSPLPELPIQYADFAAWQRRRLTGEALERDLGYWRERLAGAPAGLDLPTDRPRPAVQSTRGAAHRFAFDPPLMEALEALARRESATPFMVLAAGLFAMLSRLSGQDDLSIGTPVAARNPSEVEGLIGFFVNMLVFRADAGRDRDFLGLLRQVREVMLGAYAHQDVPFEKLVGEIAPDRDTSRNPLFQVALALQNAPLDTSLPGLVLHPEPMPASTSRFDLSFIVGGEGGALAATLEYVTDLFEPATAARLCEQWLRVLEAGVSDPAVELAGLGLLSAAERHQLLREWNDTRAESAGPALLHQAFEDRVDEAPRALAAIWEGETLTYGELEARANRLANLLRSLGAGPASPVGIWMERSLDMVVSLLAVNKAGAAYLPIDGGWPAERAEAVLAGTEAGLVLTRRAHLPAVRGLQWRLPRLNDAVCLDVATPELPLEPLDVEETRTMWDGVAERAVDWVTEAGFWSAYTGEPFPEAEVLEYRDRVIGLAEPWLRPEARVLEIGSGSGLILWETAPRVARYVGLDPSALTQERNRARAAREGHGNVELITGFAHEIEALPPGSFDLVILASSAQFFPGLVYLERVIELALSRLAPGGAVVVADLLDPRRKEDFRRSLTEHAAAHPGGAAARAAGRLGEGRELYVDEGFFAGLPGARVLHREQGFPNELRFRYDVVLRQEGSASPAPRAKRVWTGWHAAQASPERPAPAASPADVAYVIHTSGSTGKPKGIVVQHQPAVEINRWINANFGVGPGDRLLFVTSPAFDLSVYDVFGALGAGAAVHVASEEDLRDADRLVRLLVEEPITVWDSAPAALQRLAPLFPAPGRPGAGAAALRLVMLSGDWIPVKLPDTVRASFPNARVMALGGATEATIWSNWFPVREVDPRWPSIPYGRPTSNARYHVLDKSLEPCPVGVPGDLHIAGSVLCVGYARLPALTAEKFVPDPFAGEPGARMYFTGDRARYGGDGLLEFLGRVDQQVKVRGYRIELEEIEAVLARLPQVREAAVLAREDVPGDKRLVAYVVAAGEPAPSPLELRVALQQVMPEYMVPSAFVILERMPVTANGKLDRKALPAPLEVAESPAGQAPPETAVERELAAIWQEVLGLPAVGRHDDFFDLGGSSLLATQVVSRARQAFAAELPLLALFEARTLADLAEYVEELRAEAAPEAVEPEIVPAPRGGALPLSFSQQRLWVLDQLAPGSPLYNVPGGVRLSGPLEPELLRRVLAEVARRHEVLRTTFHELDGRPVQAVAPEPRISLPLVDLSGLPAATREAELARRAAAESRRPFDLAAGPLLRATLLRLGAEEHAVLATFHHIVSDGWSMGIFFREIAALFRAWSAGEPSPLPELPVQYADFAVWQRARLTGEALEEELGFWRDRLAGAPAVLELPTDRPRPAARAARGRWRALTVPAATVAPLEAWGQRHGVTLYMILLGAFASLLGRHAGQEEVVVGSPVAGRDRREIEGLIGFFVNALPMRVDLSGEPGFDRLLDRVRDMALGAFAHQNVPFERLVEEMVTVRDTSRTPLFQVMLTFQNAPMERLELPGLTLEPLAVENGTAKFDLTLLVSEADGGLTGVLEYDRDLFDEATAARLCEQWQLLLAAAAADPAADLGRANLLSPAARHQLLREWNDTRAEVGGGLLHEPFEAWADRAPEALAAVWAGETLTYGQLEERANRVANRLRSLGAGPGAPVGVWMERSLDLLAAVLGAVKTGAAYLPIGAGWPAGRAEAVLAGAVAVLTGRSHLPAVREIQERLPGLAAVCLDAGDLPETSVARPPRAASPVDVAYVIHTSGSTGKPKGIAVQHRPAAEMIRWYNSAFGVGPRDRILFVTSPAFDLSVYDMFGVLSAGGVVHVATEEELLDADRLVRLLVEEPITIWDSAPAALQRLAPLFPEPGGADSERTALRLVTLAGDWIPVKLPDALRASFPRARMMALGGPTETTVFSNVYRVGEVDPLWPSIPYGRPIPNVRHHVLDRRLEPCPIGVPGDLYTAGVCLAVGYAGMPALTAEKFLPDPFSGEPGSRMYLTGDRARHFGDGNLEFLGRVDHQVKVRGYRIELEEIEAVLARLPGVRDAAVLARGDVPGDKRLVAYVVPAAEPAPAEPELRAALLKALPEYMVPTAFVTLERMPVTANGKLDRAALPAPQAPAPEAGQAPPETALEQALAAIWREVLKLPEVGRHDDFFDLGGSSLLATQVISRMRRSLGLELPMMALFEASTLAGLADLVERHREEAADGMPAVPAAPPLAPAPRTGALPLSFAQQRLWVLDQLEPGGTAYNIPGAVRLRGPLEPELLRRVLAEVTRRHEVLRTSFHALDGQPVQVIEPAVPVALPLVDLSGLPERRREEELARRASAEAALPFDLGRAPLLRATLLRLGAEEHAVLATFHHVVSDGWSLGVFFREIAALFRAWSAGEPSPLPELPVQYADFAVWQRRWLDGEVLERELDYWRRQLAGAPLALELPADRPRPPVRTARGRTRTVTVPAATVAPLEAWGQRRGATLFMTLLGAFAALLGRYSGQDDVVVGSPIAGRDRQEIEDLIGFFVNTLALRVGLSGAPGFGALLDRVRGMALDAFAHQHVPFERLVEELVTVRDTSHTPLFQVAFALQNAPMERLELPGLTLEPLAVVTEAAKFDLTLVLSEADGGGLAGVLEYDRDLFDDATAARFYGQWLGLLAALAADPEADPARLDLLSAAERHQLLREWNDTRAESAGPALLHQAFEDRVDEAPEALAAIWEGETLTYGELEARANRLANLLQSLGAGPASPVGIWMERSLDMVVSLLAVNKAGAAYLPIDGGWPAERAEAVLAGTEAGLVLTRRAHLPAVQGLQWRLPRLNDAVCLDVATPELPLEPLDVEETRTMWDGVAERAVDWVTEAGFWSAYTGEPFPEAEVLEYRDRVIGLAEPWLRPEARVLEIGSGSGLILWETAPRVARYVGLDPSALTQERNRARAAREGHGNVELITGFAHEIEALPPGSFDLVILASSAQFFPGLVYLERVIELALSRLAPGGAVVVADLLDPRRKEDFRRSLTEHAAAHPGGAAARAAGRLGEGRELYVDEGFFAGLPGARVLHREQGFPNELRFRYDVVLRKEEEEAPVRRGKRVWTGWHASQASPERPAPAASPVDVAYVIHTSGSTGTPKGIVVQHQPAVELCRWINGAFGVGPGDRLLFVTSPAFDLSVYDVFGALGAGAAVHVASEEDLRDADRLVRLLTEEPITVWDSAPAALQRLAPLFPAPGRAGAEKTALRLVMLSGDWIPVKLPDAVRASFPNARVMALGGATEATVWSNWFPVREVDPRWPSIPYGRPIANARYHVLDKSLEPCPVGVPGDLHIAGSVLCVGYARLPALTAEKFVPDPFAGEPGARMYFTGDRARYGGDGLIEFLGRVDQQVKVRGYRIELEEIEAVLVRQPGVREAAVLAREDVPGDKRLVAYVVGAEPASTPGAVELRAALRQAMPEYMVPSAFVTLERMPVTANGKLDRKALPAPLEAAPAAGAPPETVTERALAAIWEQVLGRPGVSRHDDFFDLGGSSLLATQVVARARQELAVELRLLSLFETRTLAELAEHVDGLKATAAREGAAPAWALVPGGWSPGEPLPLSHAQQRFWFLQQLNPESSAFNLSSAVRLLGRLDPAVLEASFGEIVRRHAAVRTRFVAVDGEPRQVVDPPAPYSLPRADLSGLAEGARDAELRRLREAEARRPFDLAGEPPLRALLARLADDDHVVLLSLHHIAGDGWSFNVLTRELGDLYTAFAAGRPSPLPELPAQYADWAAAQQEWLRGPGAADQLAYWRRQLGGELPVLAFPMQRQRPASPRFRGAARPLALGAELSAALADLGRSEGATLFMSLLAAFQALLHLATGEEDLLVGTNTANRDQPGVDRLIGLFVNDLALRGDLSGRPSFRELLARARRTAVEAYANQDLPFEALVADLRPERSASPLFQVMFVLQSFPLAVRELPGLTLAPLDGEQRTANFDLTLALNQGPDGISGAFVYDVDLFDAATVARLAEHFVTLVREMVADPDRPLHSLSFAPAPTARQMVSAFSEDL